jgi:hypothetical protein
LVVLALVEVVGLEAVALGVLAATGLLVAFTAPLPELFEPVAFEVLLVFVAALPLLAPDFSPAVIVVVTLAGLELALVGLVLTALTLVLPAGFAAVLLEPAGAVVTSAGTTIASWAVFLGLTDTVPDCFAARFAVGLVGVTGTVSLEAATLPETAF